MKGFPQYYGGTCSWGTGTFLIGLAVLVTKLRYVHFITLGSKTGHTVALNQEVDAKQINYCTSVFTLRWSVGFATHAWAFTTDRTSDYGLSNI